MIPPLTDSDLDQFILQHFPTPLAVQYQKFLSAETWHDRFHRAVVLFDYMIRSLALILIQQYLTEDLPHGMNLDELNPALENIGKPTLGVWKDILFGALKAYDKHPELKQISELHELYSNKKKRNKIHDICSEIIGIRNNTVHLLEPENEDEWRDQAQELIPRLATLLKYFKFIGRYKLIDVTNISNQQVMAIQYSGIHPISVVFPVEQQYPIQVDHLYLWTQSSDGNRYYNLSPLIIPWHPDRESQDAAIYESLTKTRIRYLATLLRTTVISEAPDILAFLNSILNEIRQRMHTERQVRRYLNWALWRQTIFDITKNETETIRAKYDPSIYLERQAANAIVDQFLLSESTALLLLGKSGVGKSNFLLSLCDAYSNRDNTAILMLNAALLPADNLNHSLVDLVRQTASFEDQLIAEIENDLWNVLAKLEDIENKKLIIIFDAINENYKPRDLLEQIDHIIVKSKRPWLKVIISSRPQAWQIIQSGLSLTEQYYFRQRQHNELGIELDGFSLTEQGGELKDFTKDELPEAYAKYQEKWNLQTAYHDLPIELKRSMQDPLTLRLVAETYEGQAIPTHIDQTHLYTLYIQRLVQDKRLKKEDIIFLEIDLMQLMVNEKWFSNEIIAEQVKDTILQRGRSLWELITDTAQLDNGQRINASFTRLKDTEILIKQDIDTNFMDFVLRFKYERFYDFYAARRLLEIASKQSDFVLATQEFIDRLNTSPFLWGAIHQMLLEKSKNESSDILVEIARGEKNAYQDIVFYVLIDLKKSNPKDTFFIVNKMYHDDDLRLNKLSVKIAGAIDLAEILIDAGGSKKSDLRAEAIQATYYLWQHNRQTGWEILKAWSQKVFPRFRLPNSQLLNVMAGASILILTDQQNTTVKDATNFQNPEILKPLRDIWIDVINNLFGISVQRNANLYLKIKMLLANIILYSLLKFAVAVTTVSSLVVSRERGSQWPGIKKYFRQPSSKRKIIQELVNELEDKQTGILELEELLYQALVKSEPLPVFLTLAVITLRVNPYNVHSDIETLCRLFYRVFEASKPGMASAQLVFTTGGILLRSKSPIDSETWKIYSEIHRAYLDAGGSYYLDNSSKYEAGYIDLYTILEVEKLGLTTPTLFLEYITKALENEPAPSIPGLLGEISSLAVIGGYPQYALDAARPLLCSDNPPIRDTLSIVLARIKLYYPEIVDNYLQENKVDDELKMKVNTSVISENIWGDFIISRVGKFLSELIFVPSVRDVYRKVFLSAMTAQSVDLWMLGVIKQIVNFVYGNKLLNGE